MRQLWLVIKLLAALIVCAVVAVCTLFTMHMMGKKIPVRFEKMFSKVVPESDILPQQKQNIEHEKMLEIAEMPDLDPGDKAFQKASELLALGKTQEGRDKLNYLLEYYPNSPMAGRAKKILSVMQLDDFLSLSNNPNIVTYKVQRGDGYANLVNKNETTLDCMMHINGLSELRGLQPNDEILFLPLNLHVTIEAKEKLLTLWNKEKFLASYNIIAQASAPKNPIKSKVDNKIGTLDNKKVAPTAIKQYRAAQKTITLNGNFTLAAKPEGEIIAKGFYFSSEDVEELALLLRVGNEVEIKP